MRLREALVGRNSKYKLLVLDIDGTLITSDLRLSRRTKNAIQRVKETGIKVTFATGRQHCSAVRLAQKIKINAPLVSSDGSFVRNIDNGEAYSFPLSKEAARDVLKIAASYQNLKVEVFFADTKFYAGKFFRMALFWRYLKPPWKYSLIGICNYIKDFVFIPVISKKDLRTTVTDIKRPPLKLVICGPREELERFCNETERFVGNSISITAASTQCVDILEKGVSKAKGVAYLVEKLGISQNEVIAVGDSYNDIEMLKYAGLGVAVGNAASGVKEHADYVIKGNDEDGLAIFLEELLLIE